MTDRRVISRADLKNRINSVKPTEFFVPELDGTVFLRVMSGKERDELEASIIGHRAPTPGGRIHIVNIRARTMAYCLCDDQGKLMYDPHNPADLDELGALDIQVSQRIFAQCQKINALSDEAVEQLAKKSQKMPSTHSGLLSPSRLDIDQNESVNNGSTPTNMPNG